MEEKGTYRATVMVNAHPVDVRADTAAQLAEIIHALTATRTTTMTLPAAREADFRPWTPRMVQAYIDRISTQGKSLLVALYTRWPTTGATLPQLVECQVVRPSGLGPTLGALNRAADELQARYPVVEAKNDGGEACYALDPRFHEALQVALHSGKEEAPSAT